MADELQKQIEELESRVAEAKRQLARIKAHANRRPSATPFTLALAAASMLIAAAPLPPRVKAPFSVEDSAGFTIFRVSNGESKKITVKEKGAPKQLEIKRGQGFSLYNKSGTIALWGEATSTVAALRALSADGQQQAVMGTTGGGSNAALILRTGGQNTRMALGVPDGRPSIEMFSDSGVQIVHSEPGGAAGGSLLLQDSKGEPRVLFGVTVKNAGKVVAFPNTLAGGAMAHLYSSQICGLAGCQ